MAAGLQAWPPGPSFLVVGWLSLAMMLSSAAAQLAASAMSAGETDLMNTSSDNKLTFAAINCRNGDHNDDGDLALIRQRILTAMLPRPDAAPLVAKLDKELDDVIKSLNASNLWPDIDYNDPDGRSWWKTSIHLQRSLLLATAYRSNISRHYESSDAYGAANASFVQWLRADFQNTNWWWMEIGVPRIVGKILFLLDKPDDLLPLAVPLLERASIARAWSMTGCNRVWIASANILRACSENNGTGNATRMAEAYQAIDSTIYVSAQSQDGIQRGYSFHQHGPQLYTGWGYGAIFSTNVLLTQQYAAGTTFQFNASTWDLFARFVLQGQQLSTRGPNFDYTTCGRLMTYFAEEDSYGINHGHYHYFAAFTDFRLAFPAFDEPFDTPLGVVFAPLLSEVDASRQWAKNMTEFAARLRGDPDVQPLDVNHHFFDSDYIVHHRPGFMVSLRMFSNRTINTECGNGENLQGRDLADGVLNAYVTGREFENVYPVWQWHNIPGTTEHQTGTLNSCSDVRNVHSSPWVGCVSDGRFAACTLDFQRGHQFTMHVSKTYFFTENAVIASGAGLTSNAPYEITTSMDQRLLLSDVILQEKGKPQPTTLGKDTNQTFTLPQWLWHGNVLYVLPAALGNPDASLSTVTVSTRIQNGSWANITQGPPDPISKPVFNSFLNHGVVSRRQSPTQFAYALLPNVSSAQADHAAADLIAATDSLNLTRQVQSACVNGVLYAVAYPNASFPVTVPATKTCSAVMIASPGLYTIDFGSRPDDVRMAANNPMVESWPMKLSISIADSHGKGNICCTNCSHDSSHGKTSVTFDLSDETYKGRSVVVDGRYCP